MTGEEYKKLMAAAAKAGESQEYYNNVLNQLSELRGKLDWNHPWNGEVQSAISALHQKSGLPANSSNVITNTINIGGSFSGNLQSGESNSLNSQATTEPNSLINWFMEHIVGTVVGGVILAAVIAWLSLK